MGAKTKPFDAADYLSSEDDILDYLKIWMEDGSPQEIARAIGDVARSKGMSEIARRTGLGRQALDLETRVALENRHTIELVGQRYCRSQFELGTRLQLLHLGGNVEQRQWRP